MEAFLSQLLGDQRRFRKLVQEHDFDIVHCHKQRAVRFALKALPDKARPAIVVNHGNSYLIDDKGRKFYGNPRVRAILCVADELRQIAIRGGLDEAKVITSYTGIDTSEFDFRINGGPVRREFGISASAPVVGIIANFDGKKAYPLFFEAAVQIAAQVPDVRFLVVGRGAPDELPSQLAETGIAKQVILAGFRSDIPQVLAAMDVSVNVSNRGEGLTGAMRESLAMKKAVVCTDIGGNRELVRDGQTGRLVAPGDIPAFVEAVVELLRDKPRAQAMGEAGYALVQREFTQEVFVDKLEKIYRSLLA
jgi:glycosyltransferase involved in cell wall biosynthesis